MTQTIPKFKRVRIVFADHDYGIIASIIKGRTKGKWSHVMLEVEEGIVATQGFTDYVKVPLINYMKDGNKLKFIELDGLTDVGIQAVLDSVNKKLALPRWKRGYDFLGLIGQATGIKWIQDPWHEYCSEDVPGHLVKAFKAVGEAGFPFNLNIAVNDMPKRMSPAEFDLWQKNYKRFFPLGGYWNSDE